MEQRGRSWQKPASDRHVPQSLMYCFSPWLVMWPMHIITIDHPNRFLFQNGASFLDGFKSSPKSQRHKQKISRAPRYKYRVFKTLPKKSSTCWNSMHGSTHVGFFWSKKSRSFAELPCAQMWGSCNATWITWSRCLGWDRSWACWMTWPCFLRKKWWDVPWTTRWGVSTNQIYLFF